MLTITNIHGETKVRMFHTFLNLLKFLTSFPFHMLASVFLVLADLLFLVTTRDVSSVTIRLQGTPSSLTYLDTRSGSFCCNKSDYFVNELIGARLKVCYGN